MFSRNAVVAALFIFTLLFGAWLLTDKEASKASGTISIVELRELVNYSRFASKVVATPRFLLDQTLYYARLLTENNELLLYAAIAAFGVLMVGLAISTATSTPTKNADEILELLKQEKDKAEQLARLKSEFLNQVSHELRTPLAVILGYLECMTDGLYGEVKEKHLEILEAVSKQSTHLKNMIDQILIYSRLEASKQPLRIEGFLVQKSFLDLKDTFNFLCQQKGVGITWNMPRDLPEVQSDPERLKEIASNLLQNGLKYTDRGSIDLSVSYLPHSDSLALEVTDTGLGIPQNYLSSIFEPFVQVHKTSTGNSRGGIGLGLSIVKKHVELLKGTINVKTEVGKGTIFTVILPRTYERQSGQHRALLERLKAALRFRSDSPKRVSRPPTALPQSNPSELVPPRRVVG